MDIFEEVRAKMESNHKKIAADSKAIDEAFASLTAPNKGVFKFFWVYLLVAALLSVATLGVVVWAIGLFAGKW